MNLEETSYALEQVINLHPTISEPPAYKYQRNTEEGLQERMDTLRIYCKATIHDLEASKREIQYLRSILNKEDNGG